MPDKPDTELTVEGALAELRQMCPGGCPRVEYHDRTAIGGSLVIYVMACGLELGKAGTLDKAMQQARDWKAQQQ